MNARAVTPLVLALVAVLAGCTSQGAEPPGLTASPTPPVASSPAPEPSPTDGIQVHSDPDLGIVFDEVPDLTGDAAAVYDWIAVYHKAYWQTMTTNQASVTVDSIASEGVIARLAQIAAQNSDIGAQISGTYRARISDVVVDGDTATGRSCSSYQEVTFAADSGTYSPEEAGFGEEALLEFTLLRQADGTWYIQSVEEPGTC